MTKELDGVAKAVKKLPQDLLPDKKKDFLEAADASSSLAKLAANWITAGIQQLKLRKVVTEADPEVQKLLKAMQLLTGAYGNDFEISRNCVVKPLKHRSGSAKRSGQYLLGALGTAATREQSRRYDSPVQAVEKAQEGLRGRAVAEGHVLSPKT